MSNTEIILPASLGDVTITLTSIDQHGNRTTTGTIEVPASPKRPPVTHWSSMDSAPKDEKIKFRVIRKQPFNVSDVDIYAWNDDHYFWICEDKHKYIHREFQDEFLWAPLVPDEYTIKSIPPHGEVKWARMHSAPKIHGVKFFAATKYPTEKIEVDVYQWDQGKQCWVCEERQTRILKEHEDIFVWTVIPEFVRKLGR